MTESVVTIGNFDGVHRGHAALVRRAVAEAAGSAKVVALAFDPHPATLLRPQAVPARLSTFEQRARWLREAGANEVVRLAPTPELLDTAPEDFAAQIRRDYRCRAIVEGTDFRFGRGRRGDLDLLRRLGENLGFCVHTVKPVTVSLTDQCIATCSSTLVRWLIAHGRVTDAGRVLGRPYEIDATVVRGDRRGRELGFPTANLDTPCALPADGVYAGRAKLPDGRILPAAVSIGDKPTFDGTARAAEAFILGLPSPGPSGAIPGLPEYGWPLSLQVLAYIRDQTRFASVQSLVEQIRRDCAAVADIVRLADASCWVGAEEAVCA